MEASEQKELEKFIHAQLQKLPQREAPAALVQNVLAAIAVREKRPWWKQSFTSWPRRVQNLLFVSLLSLFAAVVYGFGRAADRVPVPDLGERLSAFAWIGRTLRSLFDALVTAVPGWPLQWIAAFGLVVALLYAACLAAGFALFKVTATASGRAF